MRQRKQSFLHQRAVTEFRSRRRKMSKHEIKCPKYGKAFKIKKDTEPSLFLAS